jgi:hypothetical protein
LYCCTKPAIANSAIASISNHVNSVPRKRPFEVPLLWLRPQAWATRARNSVAPKPWMSAAG